MGKHTYEFGYKFGLKPRKPAYPHMDHHIFSDTLTMDNCADRVHIEKPDLNRVKEIKKTSETAVYLCGGGQFAGWLLDNGMIDQLKLKVNPILLGDGIRLFGASKTAVTCHLSNQESYEHGLQFLTYRSE